MIEICTQQLLVRQGLHVASLYYSWKERKKKKRVELSCFPLSFLHFLGKDVFVRLWLSWATKYLLFHSYWCFWKPLWWPWPPNICGNTGLFKPLYTCVGSRSSPVCTVSRERPAEFFFKTEEALLCKGINHQSWSRFCNRNFQRQHLQGETIKRTTIPGFPIP